MLYAFFDGDNIGLTLERLLTENKVSEATTFSENVKTAILEIEGILKSTADIDIVILGGDDILIKFDLAEHDIDFLKSIMDRFRVTTGNTMSCGVGENIPKSIWNLHLAKLYGKNIIKGLE